jgi:AbiV family abortive infection protein
MDRGKPAAVVRRRERREMADSLYGGQAKAVEPLSDEELRALVVCLDHAQDLISAAEAVLAADKPNIAYHLAALALEEVGRHELLLLGRGAAREPVPPTWPVKHRQDHVQKLFWAFFGAAFGREVLTKKAWDEMREMAEVIHATRLAGLYAEDEDGNVQVPRDAIPREQAENLVALARARLGITRSYEARQEISEADRELQAWFLGISADEKRRAFLFTAPSMAKLAELQDARAWMVWLKEQFDAADAQGQAMIQAELARSQNPASASTKSKWRIKIKLSSASHLIAPKPLRIWNSGVEAIKLSKGAGKNGLYVDLLLAETVTVQALWLTGWTVARLFAVALNIGTRGLWWWDFAKDVSRYYEVIEDLYSNQTIELDRSPRLKVDWGTNVFSENDLRLTMQALAVLTRLRSPEQRAPYDYYIGGIQFWAKLDVHFPCEPDIYGNFHLSLKGMMRATGAWDGEAPFGPQFSEMLARLIPAMSEEQERRYVELAEAFEQGQPDGHNITLADVAAMKELCDHYFLSVVVLHTLGPAMSTAANETREEHNG